VLPKLGEEMRRRVEDATRPASDLRD